MPSRSSITLGGMLLVAGLLVGGCLASHETIPTAAPDHDSVQLT
jgi:hypothetical protein